MVPANDPKGAIYHNNRSNIYLKLKMYEKCVEDCDKGLTYDPTYEKLKLRKVLCLQYIVQKNNEVVGVL